MRLKPTILSLIIGAMLALQPATAQDVVSAFQEGKAFFDREQYALVL